VRASRAAPATPSAGSGPLRIGTAGWSIPRAESATFPGAGQHLERYARVLNCAEINSSFYRPHHRETYQRWREMSPPDFRFAVKLPRSITHEGRLRRAHRALREFLAQCSGLGDRLGPLLVQLPPSLVFEARPVRNFFRQLADLSPNPAVCEPRHASWFMPSAERVLAGLQVGRVAADPARWIDAARPGGWLGERGDGAGAVLYHRWHGSPRIYWSRYSSEWLAERVLALKSWPPSAQCWCILDNTAGGGALANALELEALAHRP
jgi:uncharacterized protein YecE (DUF72 family)